MKPFEPDLTGLEHELRSKGYVQIHHKTDGIYAKKPSGEEFRVKIFTTHEMKNGKVTAETKVSAVGPKGQICFGKKSLYHSGRQNYRILSVA